jgi:hypothetical protein
MTASTIVQAILAEEMPREKAIVAREPEENTTTPMMIAACLMVLVLISKAIFMPRVMVMGGKKGRTQGRGRQRRLHKKEESRDSADGGSYGNGTSMVCGEGSKNLVVRK